MFAESAVDNGIFNDLTDRKKKEMYEALVMIGGMTFHFYEQSKKKNDIEELKTCKLVAEKNLGYIGIKPSSDYAACGTCILVICRQSR